MTLKMVLLAAMPSAKERTTTARKPGFFSRLRSAKRTSVLEILEERATCHVRVTSRTESAVGRRSVIVRSMRSACLDRRRMTENVPNVAKVLSKGGRFCWFLRNRRWRS